MFRRNLIPVRVAIVVLLGTLLVGQEGWTECIQCDMEGTWQSSGSCGSWHENIYTKTGECTFEIYCTQDGGTCDCTITGSNVHCDCSYGSPFTCDLVLSSDCCSSSGTCTLNGGCTTTNEKVNCPVYGAAANAQASTYGGNSLTASGSFNSLSLLVVPLGAVIAIRFWRRKRK